MLICDVFVTEAMIREPFFSRFRGRIVAEIKPWARRMFAVLHTKHISAILGLLEKQENECVIKYIT